MDKSTKTTPKTFEDFTNLYEILKTLRFELKPVGGTLEKMKEHLEYDKNLQTFLKDQRIEDAYQLLKPKIDEIHEEFINASLESEQARDIAFSQYLDVYKKKDDLSEQEKSLRIKIGKTYEKGGGKLKNKYPNLEWKKGSSKTKGHSMLSSPDILEAVKIDSQKDKEIEKALNIFKSFFTYFSGFNQNRENYYETGKEASTAIATRIVYENLPKFCGNIIQFEGYTKKTKDGKEIKFYRKEEYLNAYQYLKEHKKTTQIKDAQSGETIEALSITKNIFTIEHFSSCLSQKQIEEYNRIVGHYNLLINLYNQARNKEEGFKKLPPFVTLYKQIGCGRKDPLFFALTHDTKTEAEQNKEFFKKPYSIEQILEQAKAAGEKYFSENNDGEDDEIHTVFAFTRWLKNNQEWEGIYCSKQALNTISNKYFANWHSIKDEFKDKKTVASYNKKREEQIKINDAVELAGLFAVLDEEGKEKNWSKNFFKKSILEDETKIIDENKSPGWNLVNMLCKDIEENAKLFIDKDNVKEILSLKNYKSEENKKTIKEWMDYALAVYRMLKYFRVKPNKIKGQVINPYLTNALENLLDNRDEADWFKWYDALRNYLTKKPQDDAKENKLKLNFENSTLAAGWDVNKESSNLCVILKNPQEKMFLAVMKKDYNTFFQKEYIVGSGKNKQIIKNPLYKLDNGEIWGKMEYNFWSDVSRMIPKCSTQLKAVIEHFKNSNEDFIFPIGYKVTSGEKFTEECRITKEQFELNNKVFKKDGDKIISEMRYNLSSIQQKQYTKAFQKKFLEITENKQQYQYNLDKWIDFCKYFLSKYPKTKLFEYKFEENYDSIDQFYLDVDICSYNLKVNTKINKSVLDEFVDNGKVYLFEIHNQDFNQGKKKNHINNLHTIYWNSIFTQDNNRPKLNGKAEIFYRRGLSEKEIKKKEHKGKQIIENYRFAKEKFLLHIPTTLNFCLKNENVNGLVQQNFTEQKNIYFLGLDRGEKHLVYYSLVNQEGKIVDQGTLNLPFFDKDKKPRSVKREKYFYNKQKGEWGKKEVDCWNYNDLLDAVASHRDMARKNWQTIGNIKNLKEGYISQVIHEIIKIVKDKPTYIVLEDLNTGFKRGRQKIERQVYQKFELALAQKLNFVVDKTAQKREIGSVTNALQFTPPVQNYSDIEKKKQVGIMLYTRANYTSQTDPITGWRKTIYLKKGSEKFIREQIAEEFTDIGFENGDYFFEYTDKNTGKIWKLWSGKNGESLLRYRSKRGKEKYEWIIKEKNILKILNEVFANCDKNRSLYDQIIKKGIVLKKYNDESTAWESLRFAIDLIQQIRNSGDVEKKQDDNFLLSPARDENGNHFDSQKMTKEDKLPVDADANGAFNIARKGTMMHAHIKQWIKNGKPMYKKYPDLDLFISDKEWDMYLNDVEKWKKELTFFSSRKNK